MQHNDMLTRDEIRAQMQQAIQADDSEGFYKALDLMMDNIKGDVEQRAAQRLDISIHTPHAGSDSKYS